MRPIKSSNKGIGGGGLGEKKTQRKRFKHLNFRSENRKRQDAVMRYMYDLVKREYEDGGYEVEGMELDHVFGRNDERFCILGALLSPTNLQFITPAQHRAKTNALIESGITQRHDFRSTEIQDRLINLEKRIYDQLEGAWTWEELKAICKSMLNLRKQ